MRARACGRRIWRRSTASCTTVTGRRRRRGGRRRGRREMRGGWTAAPPPRSHPRACGLAPATRVRENNSYCLCGTDRHIAATEELLPPLLLRAVYARAGRRRRVCMLHQCQMCPVRLVDQQPSYALCQSNALAGECGWGHLLVPATIVPVVLDGPCRSRSNPPTPACRRSARPTPRRRRADEHGRHSGGEYRRV